jgi:type VI secretion system protein ImpL
MKRILYTLLGFVLYLALVIALAFLLHLAGQKFWLFIVLLAVLGALACAVILWYLKKISPQTTGDPASSTDLTNLDALLRDADAKLKQANRPGIKSLASMPLLYVIGDENSAKTQTILQSGLDPELLSGQVYRDQAVLPTQMANVWLTGSAAIVEAGGTLLRQPALWQKLVKLTAPGKLGTAFSKSALQPTRAVVLCVSIERILAPSTSEQIRALAQTMNERLRQVSQTLGISLPVYVLFTKLDTVTAFAEYAANLTQDEVRTPLGSMLARLDTGAGLYAEQAAQQIGTRFDEVTYLLSEFRLELLARGGQPPALAKSYEFPRDFRKLRSGIVDFLVEVARPSQIGVNPFLRGFFFSGMRAHIVEDVLSVGASQSAPIQQPDAGATRVFSFAAAQQAAPQPVQSRSTRKVAQWAFLPHFFSSLVLTDKTALESSRASTKVSVVKRILVASLCFLFLLYLILLTNSFFNNRTLEQRAAAATRPVATVSGKDAVASVADLQTLDQLRQVLLELDGYHRDGAPLSYRWGIYRGEEIRLAACHAYGTRFYKLLLAQTQANIIVKLTGLPAKAAPTDEYQATYKPLKAWLITTSNPEKSSDFLPPVLESEWLAARTISPETQVLAQNQFDYYAAALTQKEDPTDGKPGQSCLAYLGGSKPDATLVANTRGYLNSFQGIDHVYLSMKAAADRKFPAIDFKKLYPNSVRFVSAPTIVDGAFSKDGFAFMQDAIKNPDQYLTGEEWVTGPATNAIDRGTLRAQLPDRYQADFLNAWRTFLKTAHVNGFTSVEDSAAKLHELDGPASPLLAILGVVSRNTAVALPTFAQPFQAPQSVTAPGNGPYVNPAYTGALAGIEQAIHQMLSNPANANDPTAVNAAVGTAYGAVSTLRGAFQPPDPAGIADANTERILREPIKASEDLAGKVPGKAANGAGADFCKASAGVLGKFPFNPDAKVDVSPEEAAAFFGPAGPIAQFVAAQSKLIAFNGTLYTSASPVAVNPALLNFLNATRSVASTLFVNGSTQPTLSFTIAQESSPSLTPATLEIDGSVYGNVGIANRIAWQFRPQGSIKLAGSGQTKNNFGPWSIFHFAYAARHPAPNKLEYVFQNNGITEKSPTGADIIYRFDIEDNGARLLNPDFMRHQLRCVSTVAK